MELSLVTILVIDENIMASRASSAEQPCAPPKSNPDGDTGSETAVGFTRGDIIGG